jgi:microcystin-dependent protein
MTKKSYIAIVYAALLLALGSTSTQAAVDGNPPDRMTYQGYLADGNGKALAPTAPKNFDVIFRIYNALTGGVSLWAEQQTVTVDNGSFSVMLGEGSQYSNEQHPLLGTIFAGADASDRYLEITVKGIGANNTDVPIVPRLRMLTSPYAFLARGLGSASGKAVTVSNGNVGVNKDNPGSALDVNGTVTATGMTVNGTSTATTFVGNGTIPVGGIIMWSGATPPVGWALCDGNTSNGVKTPDLRGRFVLGMGAGSGLTARTLAQASGEETHLLTAQEMPVHSHGASGSSTSAGDHTHTYVSGWGSRSGIGAGTFHDGEIGYGAVVNTSSTAGGHTHPISVTVANTGGGAAHNIMPPYFVLAYIMRVQ